MVVYRIKFEHPVPAEPSIAAAHGAWIEQELNILVDEKPPVGYDCVLEIVKRKYPGMRMIELRVITEVDINGLQDL